MATKARPAGRSVPLVNPALLAHASERGQSVENRFADRITAFSGSMRFVYLHVIWFASWIAFGVERLANQEWATVQEEDKQNEELLRLSRQILELTTAMHEQNNDLLRRTA
jgi:hypothetical protein